MQRMKTFLMAAACAASLAATAGDGVPALHLDWLDPHADPTRDFYAYANGGWLKANPVPADRGDWGSFEVLDRQVQDSERQMLEDLLRHPAPAGSETQKVADFYAAGMDEPAIEAAGLEPLKPELRRIGTLHDLPGLEDEIAHLQMLGVNALFQFGEIQDLKDSSRVVGYASQGGLGLPDRDYYLKDDGGFGKVRAVYSKHLAAMFRLLGEANVQADADAVTALRIETALARASMSRADQEVPANIYHPLDRAGLQALTPHLSWERYFSDLGHPGLSGAVVGMPDFFKTVDRLLAQEPLGAWQSYLRWQLVHAGAPYLSRRFVDEDFRLHAAITGAATLRPRWQRVLAAENHALDFALGRLYVQRHFPPAARQGALDILHGVRAALQEDLGQLPWMSPPTRAAAEAKLDLMAERIGYPDRWRDYSALTLSRASYAGNVMAANQFLQQRALNKIGKPLDRSEWSMPPQEVNAYYDTLMNNINFPAAILQPPFYDPGAPAAVNYGALGSVMGHEMTHGFDDWGAQFDGHGNLRDWWQPDDLKRFQQATSCISGQFSGYTVHGGVHLQGNLVKAEATADLGGLMLAWRAFHASPGYRRAPNVGGFTPDQQFFLGAAHVWAENVRPESQGELASIDEHPPGKYRVNGTLANLPEFQETWNVPADSPMVNRNRCVIW